MTSADTALFVEQVAWLANEYLRDSSRQGVLTWVGDRLSPDVRRRWMRGFPVQHAIQLRAEGLLLDVLTLALHRSAADMVRLDTPTRHVDWTATYARAAGDGVRPPVTYVARVARAVPDRSLLGALVAIARGWKAALEWAADDAHDERTQSIRERARALGEAIARHEREPLPAVALDRGLAERLRRCGPPGAALYDALDEVLRFWGAAFSHSVDDVAALRALGASLRDADVQNTDTLLELTASLSIARAATQANATADWTGKPWMLAPVRLGRGGKYPPLVVSSGALHCEISKGAPRHGHPRSHEPVDDLVSPWMNEVLYGGEARATHRQPDIVLRFWHVDRPERVLFALGDAKRNVSGDGDVYLRDSVGVAAVYLMAYGHALELSVGSRGSGRPAVHTSLSPAFTIFCRQRAGRGPAAAIEILRGERVAVPTVMAIDVDAHFAVREGAWESPSLSAWFCCLARQAQASLARI